MTFGDLQNVCILLFQIPRLWNFWLFGLSDRYWVCACMDQVSIQTWCRSGHEIQKCALFGRDVNFVFTSRPNGAYKYFCLYTCIFAPHDQIDVIFELKSNSYMHRCNILHYSSQIKKIAAEECIAQENNSPKVTLVTMWIVMYLYNSHVHVFEISWISGFLK